MSANHGHRLEHCFCVLWKAVNTSSQHGMYCWCNRDTIRAFSNAISGTLSYEYASLDQSLNALLQIKRISCGTLYLLT